MKQYSGRLSSAMRWYGPADPVELQHIKQSGASGVVSALHQIPHGEVWPLQEIRERKALIQAQGLEWEVVESVPVHEEIKTWGARAAFFLENYKQTLRNLAACGIKVVCYNFMPVLDWVRTRMDFPLLNGGTTLSLDWVDLALFDLFILNREGAELEYSPAVITAARRRFEEISAQELARLTENILMGVPTEKAVSLDELSASIERYRTLGAAGLRNNLIRFLRCIEPTCLENGIRMSLHPDDPPYSILGLPRIASRLEDFLFIANQIDRPFCGFCFCTGSLAVRPENDLPEMIRKLGDRIYFAHLRNIETLPDGSFYESTHLQGRVNMYEVVKALIEEKRGREEKMYFRPDHGHQLMDDLHKAGNPGYSGIGRMKGLAELRGLELALLQSYSP